MVTAIHLSVVNAPVFGGRLHLVLPGSNVDDRKLDILVVEDMPISRVLVGTMSLFLRRHRLARGIRIFHADSVRVHSDTPQGVILDGEPAGRIPGNFHLVAEGLRVMVPQSFEDNDDPPIESPGS